MEKEKVKIVKKDVYINIIEEDIDSNILINKIIKDLFGF